MTTLSMFPTTLLYADDTALVAATHEDLQMLIDAAAWILPM